MKIDALTLADGSTFISVESMGPGPVQGSMLVHLGSADDPENLRGRSHLLEHLISAGQWPQVRLTGAATRRDSMVFSAAASASADLLAFFASVRHPDIGRLVEKVREQRNIVLREIEQTRPASGRSDAVSIGMAAILGVDSPYRHWPAGTHDHVRDLRVEHAVDAARKLEESPPPVLVMFHAGDDRAHVLASLRGQGAEPWRPSAETRLDRFHPPAPQQFRGQMARSHIFVRLPPALTSERAWAASVATGHAMASGELSDLPDALRAVGVPAHNLKFTSYPMWRNHSVGHFSFALVHSTQPPPEPAALEQAMRGALASTERTQVRLAHEKTRRLRAFRDPLAAFELVRSSYLGQSSVEEFAQVDVNYAQDASALLQQAHVHEYAS